jgi:putative endonuclease
MSGYGSYRAGLAAEEAVARRYVDQGGVISARRWRGPSGEIDMIVHHQGASVLVEVKQSRTHAQAAERLTARQMGRIYASASEYLAGEPAGQDSDARFDVALVDAQGCIEVLANAFAA